MSIERVSRYNNGTLAQIAYQHTKSYQITVYRAWPSFATATFTTYTWKYGDSLANLADRYCGGPKYWWEIMDLNPEITHPLQIEPGTVIRIPYGQ
jgi:nucleoid-associated protein YgaU